MKNILKTLTLLTIIIVLLSFQKIEKTEATVVKSTSAFKTEDQPKVKLKTRLDVAMEILMTSPAYLKKTKGLYEAIVKNGGTSFGISVEGSPNPKKDKAIDYSKTYDFSLHESYSDRMPVIASYTFDPTKKQLYQYDPVEGELNPIAFDKKLIVKFNALAN